MQTTTTNLKISQAHLAFFPILVVTGVLWYLYRSLFFFPVWFDETIGKALFFGLPVWLYSLISPSKNIIDTFSAARLKTGLLLGIAIGGIFGFAVSLLALWQQGGGVNSALLFESNQFWIDFFLALMTGFWETLLFYSFVMVVLQEKYPKLDLGWHVLGTATIFLLFHLPNIILRFQGEVMVKQAVLLFLFAIGQAFLFAARRNGYALTLSHAIWGMVLLIYAQ